VTREEAIEILITGLCIASDGAGEFLSFVSTGRGEYHASEDPEIIAALRLLKDSRQKTHETLACYSHLKEFELYAASDMGRTIEFAWDSGPMTCVAVGDAPTWRHRFVAPKAGWLSAGSSRIRLQEGSVCTVYSPVTWLSDPEKSASDDWEAERKGLTGEQIHPILGRAAQALANLSGQRCEVSFADCVDTRVPVDHWERDLLPDKSVSVDESANSDALPPASSQPCSICNGAGQTIDGLGFHAPTPCPNGCKPARAKGW